MQNRLLSPLDRLIIGAENALRTVAAPAGKAARENPAHELPEAELDDAERRHSAGLMRVNHAGEIAAQGLYQGHAAVARDPAIEQQMQHAASEELDHLAWCEQRLRELNEAPSKLSPIWYTGAFAIGAVSGRETGLCSSRQPS
jgi:ubiquinone biosynthesis monooxygenase Coq7